MDEKIFSGIYDAESGRIAADSMKATLNDSLWEKQVKELPGSI